MVKKFSEFILEKNIIKNAAVFEESYTPSEIVERGETNNLYNELSKFFNYGVSNNIFLVGPSGTGKTVTLNYVKNELLKKVPDFYIKYINCSDKTQKNILNMLVKGTGRLESEERLKIRFLNELNKNCLIILDEIDKGIKIRNLLYFLSRPSESLENFKNSISIVLVSNDLNFDDSLDTAIRSSLQLRRISFSNYSKNQIYKILKSRADEGLQEKKIENVLLDFISEKVSKDYTGDCRVAIKVLFYAAQLAEEGNKEKIDELDINKAFPKASKDLEKNKLTRLSNRNFLILYAIKESKDKTMESVYNEFQSIIKTDINVKEIGKTMFYYVIEYLENQGLIKRNVETTKIGNEPPRRIIKITCNVKSETIEDELKNRFLELVKK